MPIRTLDDKFRHELEDIYDAEHRFMEAQREMAKKASDSKLKSSFHDHIDETKQQIENLEQAFKALGMEAKRVKCDGAAGLVSEAEKTMKEAADDEAVLDCVIAAAATKAEHYEIASYRGLVIAVEQMGPQEIRQLLHQNLQQEEQTAQRIEDQTPRLLQKALDPNR